MAFAEQNNEESEQKAFAGLFFLIVVLATALFFPAWSINYRQAWIFLTVFSMSVSAITLYLMKKDPKLLERRVRAGPRAEKRKGQKNIQFLAQIGFIAVIAFPAIDHRFAWSKVPPYITVAGDVFVALGLLIVFFVFKKNTFASAIVEVTIEQKVISTGPYGLVRHPMYIGALVMLFGVPLALGSWWGLFTIIPITLAIVWRLLDEENFMVENLRGYAEYRNKVRYRLVPFVW